VIDRAKGILGALERNQSASEMARPAAQRGHDAEPMQIPLFASVERRLMDELASIDVAHMTPMQALHLLHKWSEEVKK
jgi:DNA mismatch repair ATPase MutS